MKNPLVRILAPAAALAWLGVLPGAAQAPAEGVPARASGKIPRAPDGHPDLSGIWQAFGVSLFGETGQVVPNRPQNAKGAAARPRREPPPYQAWAAAKAKELAADDRNDPQAHCLLVGVPRITGEPMPLEIDQLPKKTIILYEAFHAFRIIPTDGRGHPKDLDPTFMGDSAGHWEGDTFVVDVTGFNEKTWLDGAGHFHSDQLHVTERYTRNADDTISYEAIIEDPKVLTKPWTQRLTLHHPPRDERIMEYECAENNVDLPHIETR